jgi:complex iron-sulfur molybdoenzyme family reductase subunit gamma
MQAVYVSGVSLEALLEPDGAPWRSARGERVALSGTPAGMQPTEAVRVAWTGKEIGAVHAVEVAALHTGEVLAFRLAWDDPREDRVPGDPTAFADGAAILLPSVAGAPIVTMGAEGAAVTAWYWRADQDAGRHVVAEGLGTTRTVDESLVRARGFWKGGRWQVVLARALRVDTAEPVAQLEPGGVTGYGVAVWEGSRGERAGIKAFSGDWRELRLAPVAAARR